MSKGLGKIEQLVLKKIKECERKNMPIRYDNVSWKWSNEDGWAYVADIVEKINCYLNNLNVEDDYVTPFSSVYQSVYRAIRSLEKKGHIISLKRSYRGLDQDYASDKGGRRYSKLVKLNV